MSDCRSWKAWTSPAGLIFGSMLRVSLLGVRWFMILPVWVYSTIALLADIWWWYSVKRKVIIFCLLAVTLLFGLLAMWLASDAVLPFDYVKYATQLQVNFVQSCERTDHANWLDLVIHNRVQRSKVILTEMNMEYKVQLFTMWSM